ncbi:hypothetical protein AOLI_G00326370 [Acnodon oligacanthus]
MLWRLAVLLFGEKPEFVTVFDDQCTEIGGKVVLSCKANTKYATATWEKDGTRLVCVQGRHSIKQNDRLFVLEIQNFQEKDEGNYTLTLRNPSGDTSWSAFLQIALREWREMPRNANEMMQNLKTFKICNEEVSELRFLLHGPQGAGKSSIINTIKSIFENQQYINCAAAQAFDKSFTLKFDKYPVEQFAFYDVMGLVESQDEGMCTGDIISALKGHIKTGYKFRPGSPITEDSRFYIENPGLDSKIHCLVSVLPADKTGLITDGFLKKMRIIREEANELGIPQVVFLTRVDNGCAMTGADLSKIYRSRVIKKKMEECSVNLTVPMNCIFPVKNYHEETQLNDEINCLMLDALTHIVKWANDYLEHSSSAETK